MHPFILLQWQIWLTACAVASMHSIDHRRLPHQREARMVRSLAIREGVVTPPKRRPSLTDKAIGEARSWGFERGKVERS